jgi:PAS domain S-box-containing protein
MKYNTLLSRMPYTMALYYLLIAGVWMYLSEKVLRYFVYNVDVYSQLSTYEGWLFVAVTAVILYVLLKRNVFLILEREQQYQTLADSGQALVWLAGTDKLCTYFNKTWLEFTGRTREQEMGNGWAEGVHPDDLERCLDIYTRSFDRREKFSMDYRLRRHDGEYRWLQDSGSPRFNSSMEFIGYIGFCLDVTEGKQLEVELTKNNEFMAAILDCLSDGVVACDKDGRVSLFNRSTREFYGIPPQPLLPEQWSEYYNLYEADGCTRMTPEHVPLIRTLQGLDVTNQEMVIAPHTSKSRTVLVTGRQLVKTDGEILGAVVSLHDITMVKTLEEQIQQTQKLESIGVLAGGVAHDFNNILTVIIGATALLEMEIHDNSEQLTLISQISSSAERATRLTQSLLAFSRKQTISRQVEDVVSIVKIMQDFLSRIIGEDILLTTYLPDCEILVMIDRGQIEQVLMNLVVNARDAMPDGGVLDISVTSVVSDGTIAELEGCCLGDYALISVSDTGVGIDPSVQKRIFEPFFTTKLLGKGSGLGLSMAYGIVRQHDGIIHVVSESGSGTTLKIYLPQKMKREKMVPAQASQMLTGGTETILLVEDDPEVLAINKAHLERAGYLVLSAYDGIEALELFKHGADTIALVVLDVVMPVMNGREVYEKLKAHKKDVKVLFASGYTADILKRNGVVQENVDFIPKPLNPPVFLARVRGMIQS